MDPARSRGDICVQACANDPQVAVHAIRNLARVAFGTAAVRYSQLGFGRTSSTTREQATPRNLFGFKDGTNNLKAEDTGALDEHVWVADGDGPAWMTGGTYLVTRRIRMRIENWDRTTLLEQERVIGRQKGTGAPNRLRRRVRRARLRHQELEGHPADRRRRPRPARLDRAPRRHRDPAPRLQLHRRLGRFRPPRRRAVLHRVRAQPRHAVHPDADGAVPPRRAQRVHHPHRHRHCSPARRDCARATRRPTGARRCSPDRPALRARRAARARSPPPRVPRAGSGSDVRPVRAPLLLGDHAELCDVEHLGHVVGSTAGRRRPARPCGRCP